MATEQSLQMMNGTRPSILDTESDEAVVRVLAVDDDANVLDLTATFLERERDRFSVITETNVHDALDRIADEPVDAIVSDFDMPRMNGLEFLDATRNRNTDIPFILFTGKGSEEIASEAISKGVTDYLQKKSNVSQYSLLANRILNAVEQHSAAKALKHSEEKFSKLVKNSSDVIGIVDENARFKYVSESCKPNFGYEQEELLGTCAFDYMPIDDRQEVMEEFFRAVEDPGYEPTVDFRFEHPDGGWTHIEARGKNLVDDELISGMVINARDVTELKEHEKELEQQNEQLENMRNVISHDLRSPLNVAEGFLGLFREERDDKHLDKVENAVERMNVMLEQMLTLADNDTQIEETEELELARTVQSAWEMVETGSARLHVNDSKRFEADPARFRQLLENLITNAVQHGGDDVTVAIGTMDSGLYVEDDGPGIPEADREQVFESGFSTSSNGTGFGLNIVKQIAVGHGWDIAVTDGEDGGARFEITGVSFKPTVYR